MEHQFHAFSLSLFLSISLAPFARCRQVGKKVIQWGQIAARLPAFNHPEVTLVQEKYTAAKAR